MIISTIVLSSIGSISFENPGIRLELFLKELSRQTGQTYRCPAYLNNEVLTARFADRPLEEVKTQLARVVHSTWTKKDDGWWLVQTEDQKKEEVLGHRQLRRTVLQDLIDGAKALTPTQEWTIRDAESYSRDLKASNLKVGEKIYTAAEKKAVRGRSAQSRFAASLVSKMTPELFPIDQMEPDFSLYTINGDSIGRELSIETAKELDWFSHDYQLQLQMSSNPAGIISHATRVLVTVPNTFPTRISMEIYDPSWRFVSIASSGPWMKSYKAEGEAFPLSTLLEENWSYIETKPKPDAEEAEIEREIDRMQKIRDRNDKVFLAATKTDPLGLLAGMSWIDFSKYVKKPMLANLSESIISNEPKTFVPKESQSHLTFYAKRIDADGWVLGTPADPLWNRMHRVDRSSVEMLTNLNQIDGEKITIEQRAAAVDIRYMADIFFSGIPNDELLSANSDLSGGTPTAVLGTMLRDSSFKIPMRASFQVSRLPPDAQGYLLQSLRDSELFKLLPENLDVSPNWYLSKNWSRVTVQITTDNEPFFRYKTQDGEDDCSLFQMANVIASLMESKSPLINLLPMKVSSMRTVEVAICLGDRKIKENLDDPPSRNYRSYVWGTLPPEIKQRVLDKMRENSDEDPPK